MKFKLCLENGSKDEKKIYRSWFRDMGWDSDQIFEFVGTSPDPRGLMYIREKGSDSEQDYVVHKHMFICLNPTTELGDWL